MWGKLLALIAARPGVFVLLGSASGGAVSVWLFDEGVGWLLVFLGLVLFTYFERAFVSSFGRLARYYWWPALILGGLGWAVLFNDQVRDLLEAAAPAAQQGDGLRAGVAANYFGVNTAAGLTGTFGWLLGATAWFGFNAWGYLRLASEFVDPSEPEPEKPLRWRSIARLQAARLAGIALPLVFMVRYIQLGLDAGGAAGAYWAAAALFLAVAAALYLVFWSRRIIALLYAGRRAGEAAPELRRGVVWQAFTGAREALERSGPSAARGMPQWGSLLMIGAHASLIWTTWARPVDGPSIVGAPALVVFAAAGFLSVGWVLFTYIPHRTGWAALPLVVAAYFGLVSHWNDNHDIDTSPVAADAFRAPAEADAYARAWLADRERLMEECGFWPIYVVAAEGGGIRAAYWTGAVLGRLEEATQVPPGARDCGSFADHVFMISGVSGGSLGAATFAASLEDGWTQALDADPQATEPALGTLASTEEFLRQDYLSPVVAAMLYPDAMARLSPLVGAAATGWDRARWMEGAWETRWRRIALSKDAASGGAFEADYRALWSGGRIGELLDLTEVLTGDALIERARRLGPPGSAAPGAPVLAMNATSVHTGAKWVAGPVRFAADAARLGLCDSGQIEDLLASRSMSLATAAHLSARFTYISPAGRLDTSSICMDPDESGANTAEAASLEALADRSATPPTRFMRFVDGGYFEDSGAETALEAVSALRRVLLEECGPRDGGAPEPPSFCEAAIVPVAITTDLELSRTAPPLFAPELRSPLSAVFSARGARGSAARRLFAISGDAVEEGGRVLARSGEADMPAQAVTQGPMLETGDGRQLYIDIRLPRRWCRVPGRDGTYEPCALDDPRPSRLLPLGWTLSDWAVERMNSALEAQFGPNGCGAAAVDLVRGEGEAIRAIGDPTLFIDGRCDGRRWGTGVRQGDAESAA